MCGRKKQIMNSWLNTLEVRAAYDECRVASVQHELERGRVGAPAINFPVLKQLAAGGHPAIAAAVLAQEICGSYPTGPEMAEAHRTGATINCVQRGTETLFYVEEGER